MKREMLENKHMMLANRNTRRLSLDMVQKSGERIKERGIFRYMDLRFPQAVAAAANDINSVACECCGLLEECTSAYVRQTRARFYGKWVCGLCSEAVNEESKKMHGGLRGVVREEALRAHMKVCRAFNTTIRVNPAMALAYSMTRILKAKTTKHGLVR